jgi:hypothetical protein
MSRNEAAERAAAEQRYTLHTTMGKEQMENGFSFSSYKTAQGRVVGLLRCHNNDLIFPRFLALFLFMYASLCCVGLRVYFISKLAISCGTPREHKKQKNRTVQDKK